MRHIWILIVFLLSSVVSLAQPVTGNRVTATSELIAERDIIWLGQQVKEDSLAYMQLKPDSMRFRTFVGEWTPWMTTNINRLNFQDSIATYQTDNQQLSIDSLNRVFTISLEDGGSVKFLDTNTQYDLDSLVSGIRDSVDYLYIWDKSQSDSLIYLYSWNTNQSDSINVNRDSIENYNDRILTLESFEEIDPIYSIDSSYIKQTLESWLNSIAYGITEIDTAYWNNKIDDVSGIEQDINTLYLYHFNQSDSLINLYQWNTTQSDSIENIYTWNYQQSDSIQFLYDWNYSQSDTLNIHGDSITNYNNRLLILEGFDETDPIYSLDSASLKTHVRNDDDLDATNELQDLSINNHVISLTQSIGTIDLSEYINPDLSYLEERDLQQSDSISALFNWNNNQSDSLLSVYQWNYLQSDTLIDLNNRLADVEGFDTTGIYHWNRSLLDKIGSDDTLRWNLFSEWDKDYFDLINLPNIADSISTYQTDNQQLSIDSVGRVFTVSLEDGSSVKFKDTNTEYDLSGYATRIELHDTANVVRSEFPTMLTELDSTGFRTTVPQVVDLADSLATHRTDINQNTSDIASINAVSETTEHFSGSITTYNISNTPVNDVNVYLNGVLQQETTDYTVSGTTVIYTGGLPIVSQDLITIKYKYE